MALLIRKDEQIKVGTTPGLIAGSSSFTFDGTSGKPDYRGYEITISELTGRGILAKGLDYGWSSTTGLFTYLQGSDIFPLNQYFNVHFDAVSSIPVSYDGLLINSSFFIRNINLTNLNKDAQLARINLYIQKYEPECLKKILGVPLYRLLLTETSQRMTDLINGSDYLSPSSFNRTWQGLVHDTNQSLIANYIYYYYQESLALETTGVGTKAVKAEASEAESPADKMVNAWRFFASETRDLCSFLWNKQISGSRVYIEFTSYDYQFVMNLARKGGVNKYGF